MQVPHDTVRIAAMSDLHCTEGSHGAFQATFARASEEADILVLCGDLTDYGRPEEAKVLARELGALKIPAISVLGNHDFESDKQDDVKRILGDAGLRILDGTTFEFRRVGFAGVKGFAGGFGRRALAPWGERTLKRFVHEGMEEALKLESALARLWNPVRVAILHYAPIQATVHGEPPEIFAFLGSSRLEDPVDRYRASVCFHGHAHHGTAEGHTKGNVPVFNVAFPLLRALHPEAPPYRIVELEVPPLPAPPPQGADVPPHPPSA